MLVTTSHDRWQQMFSIVLVEAAVGFILLMVYRDILSHVLHCLAWHDRKICRVVNFAGERLVENIWGCKWFWIRMTIITITNWRKSSL